MLEGERERECVCMLEGQRKRERVSDCVSESTVNTLYNCGTNGSTVDGRRMRE